MVQTGQSEASFHAYMDFKGHSDPQASDRPTWGGAGQNQGSQVSVYCYKLIQCECS